MSTSDIQRLREQTGVGMMDAKRALEATGRDMSAAIEHLRKSGQKIAASKSRRQVTEGAIGVWLAPDRKRGALVSVACETDFVARTPEFQKVVEQLSIQLGEMNQDTLTVKQFLAQSGPNGMATVRQFLDTVITQLGENILISSIAVVTTKVGSIASYLHASRKVAVFVVVDGGGDEVSHNVAMHIAAMNPRYLSPKEVPSEVVAKEQEIYREQLKREGKPEAMWDNILSGKLKKFFSDICLVEQIFVKDHQLSVGQYLQQSGGAMVHNFVRLTI